MTRARGRALNRGLRTRTTEWSRVAWTPPSTGTGPAIGDGLQLEDASFVLLEDGSFLLLE
jgi:hypothetical protein